MKTDVTVDIDTLISECQELCVIIDGLKNTQLKDDNIAFLRDFNKKYKGFQFDEIISQAAEKRIENLAAITKKIDQVFDKKVITVATLEKEHELNRPTDKMNVAYEKYQHKNKFVESLSPTVTNEDINECIKYRKEYEDACKERNAILYYCNYHSFEETLSVCKKINAQCDIYLPDKNNIIKNDDLDVFLGKTQKEKGQSKEKMNSEKMNYFIYNDNRQTFIKKEGDKINIDNSQTFIKKEGDKVNNDNRKTFVKKEGDKKNDNRKTSIKKEGDKVYNQTLNYDKITNNYQSNKSKDEVSSDKNAGKEKSNANASYNCDEKTKKDNKEQTPIVDSKLTQVVNTNIILDKRDKDEVRYITDKLFDDLCAGDDASFFCKDNHELFQYLILEEKDYSSFVTKKHKEKALTALWNIQLRLTNKDWFDEITKRMGYEKDDTKHRHVESINELFNHL